MSLADVPFLLLCGLLVMLWLAGGASRPDVFGQVVVRATAWLALIAAVLTAPPPQLRGSSPVAIILALAILLPLIQLIPLPPGMWQALPGRDLLAEAARLTGDPQPWRPIAIVPDATANALASLVVPGAILLLAISVPDAHQHRLPGLLLALVVAAMLLGLVQFSGGGFNNPLLNDTPGQVSGSFANRNHFALFLALGCVVAPAWSLSAPGSGHWRVPVAWGLVLLFLLTIIASGSRAGLGLGAAALLGGLLLSRRGMKRALARYPRWLFPALVGGVIASVMLFVLLIMAADRAASIDRLFVSDGGQDMRVRGLPVVLAMIREYFPVGSGFGGFDPVFRIHEPLDLLKPTYFNHAHDDFLEVALDGGLPAVLLLAGALLWWGWASVRAWRGASGTLGILPRLGSAMIGLVLVASLFDYPARTPMVMALLVLAAVWLARGTAGASALPRTDPHL